jgi:nicotinate-nucleotide adenylyltransferase
MTEPTTPQLSPDELRAWLPPLRGFGRVGLLGGSFNPPHVAHVLLALTAYATHELDHLWVIPTADHPFAKDLAPFDDRLRMCFLAFRHLAGGAAVLDVEKRLPKPSFTVQTVRALKAALPDLQPRWIAGSDILGDLPRWREPEAFQQMVQLVVIPRPGFAMPGKPFVALPSLSSTDVRERLAAGDDVSGLLDLQVLDYIEKRGLYGVRRSVPE